ncbi:MAG: hypothetical protein H7263_05655 [Candidatus Sericytochromatia bacterium]|nr:hypothetical protein [Candidatus Sericytochromatia bacterium]
MKHLNLVRLSQVVDENRTNYYALTDFNDHELKSILLEYAVEHQEREHNYIIDISELCHHIQHDYSDKVLHCKTVHDTIIIKQNKSSVPFIASDI